MGKQIHKRLPEDFVKDLMETFCAEEIGREQACELLGLSKAQFYRWREKYLTFRRKREEFKLDSRESKPTRYFPPEVEKFLHEELYYITRCEGRFKNKFNFSFLGNVPFRLTDMTLSHSSSLISSKGVREFVVGVESRGYSTGYLPKGGFDFLRKIAIVAYEQDTQALGDNLVLKT